VIKNKVNLKKIKESREGAMLQVKISNNKLTLQCQIKALKYALKHDISDKDKQIYSQSLKSLEKAYDNI